jgi:hypothetical protein
MVAQVSLLSPRTGRCIALLCSALDLADIERSRSVVDCNDLDLISANPVNEAIVAENDLSDVLNFQFWDDPPRAWVVCEAIGRTEGAIGEHGCNLRCVASDEEADRVQVIESLWRPRYLSHFAIRWRASS